MASAWRRRRIHRMGRPSPWMEELAPDGEVDPRPAAAMEGRGETPVAGDVVVGGGGGALEVEVGVELSGKRSRRWM
jgi:hypothetical protein